MKAEYLENKSCLQRDSVERKAYAGAPSAGNRESRERDDADDLLERILDRDNLNRAYKQVKRNHGAPGIDGMTVADARRGHGCGNTERNFCKAFGMAHLSQTRCGARKSPNQMAVCESLESRR